MTRAHVSRLRVIAVATLLVVSRLSSSPAQRVIEIAGEPTCSACKITVEKSVTLRPPPNTPRFRFPTKIVRDSRGRWYVLDPTGDASVASFDSSGAFLGRLSYPSGQRYSDGVAISGDTVRLFGLSAPSAADFSPEGRLVRTHAMFASGATGATPLTGGGGGNSRPGETVDVSARAFMILSP